MSKTIVSMLVVGVIIVGGYFVITKNPKKDTGDIKNGQQVESTKTEGKKMAFSAFVKQGGAYKCEVKQAFSDMENSGTVYMSGGNIRGEYTTIAEGRTIDTSFMLKDGYSYTWSSTLVNIGFKTKINTQVDGTNAVNSGTYSWNASQIGDYNCEPWTTDEKMFEVPAGMSFKEV
jgi:hypothetical protein